MPFSVDDRQLPDSAASRDASVEATSRWLDAELGGQPVPPLLAVIGLGDGELLDVLERRAPSTKVLALEPNAAGAASFLSRAVSQRWRESGRLVYLVDPDYSGADEAWRAFPAASPDAHKLIVRPEIARTGGPAAVRAARTFKQILFGVRANAEARRKFAPGYLAGSLHNLPEVIAGQDIRALTDAYKGVPAIIAAAGPSLDDALRDLAGVGHRGLIVAADTALRPLLQNGLAPQFVVAVDPQAMNARHFHQLPDCPDTWLVSEASIDPTVIRPFDGRAFWFRVSNHEPWSWFNEIGVDVGRVDVWGSVLTAAFQVAVLAGCDPIVLVGADLAFTGNHPYCRGTTYEFDWAHLAAEGQPIEQGWRPFLRQPDQIRVPDVRGVETITTPSMQSFRDWLVGRVRRSGRRVINATGAGIVLGDGIEQASLRDVLRTERRVPRPSTIARRSPATASAPDIARRLWDVHRTVCRNGQSTPPLDKWREFCGEGFDLDVVGAAVERAARTLERSNTSSASNAIIPWTTLGPSTRAVVSHLPEAVGRFRAALTGAGAAPASLEREHVDARLSEAFDLLRSIWAASATSDDLASPVPDNHLGRVPLGAMQTWPVEFGRAVRLFEGLLGDCFGELPVAPAAEASFFTRPAVLRDLRAELASDAPASTANVNLAQACTYLALEWLLAASFSKESAISRHRVAAWWRGLASAISTAFSAPAPDRTTLTVASAAASPIELVVPVQEAAMARVLTGTVRTQSGRAARPLVIPRVLTDEGVVRGVQPYATDRGAMCTVLRGSESFLVRENGATEPGFVWPRPTNGELPFGNAGAIAWSVGPAARWPEGGSGYVMYRQTPDERPRVESLPFAPQAGVWWRDRAYWACYPFGVGSWAPSAAAEFALPHLTLFSVLGDDRGLLLGPRARTKDGVVERRLITQGFRWTPGQDPEELPLGPRGVVSSRTTAHGWTAHAHPEADAIEFVSVGGVTVSMTCYYPFGIAWAGRSLLVSTTDGELLFFERLTDVLESWTGGRP